MTIFTKRQLQSIWELEDSVVHDYIQKRLLIPSVRRSNGPGRPHLFSFNDAVMAALLPSARAWFGGYPDWLEHVAAFLSSYPDLECDPEPIVLLVEAEGESDEAMITVLRGSGNAVGLRDGKETRPFRSWIDLAPAMARIRGFLLLEDGEGALAPEEGRCVAA